MIKVLFLIRSLDTGGAERQLVELVKNLDKTRFEALVVTFYAGGNLPNELISLPGVTLYSLGKNGRWNNLAFIRKLIQLIRAQQPDLIHSYLDVANLFALLVGKITHLPVVWGVRASKMALEDYDWTARLSYWLTVLFSGLADWIIINSNAGKEHHVQNGYFSKKITVIPNGIDVDR
ncbi:MAG: glycosyltransferase, partial [Anaerolineae bacterium]|nr:glycosyltransferase [Anaerolineae bacterium]